MRISQLKTIVDALGKFATIRERSDDVTTRLGVQAGGGHLKFVAGDGVSGIVVDAQETAEVASFYTDFRPFAQGVKVLPAKSDVTLSVSPKGLTIGTESGGTLQLPNRGMLQDAGFARKPSGGTMVSVPDIALRQMSKLFPAVTKGDEKLSEIHGCIDNTPLTVTFVEPRVKTKYASWTGGSAVDTEWKPFDVDGAFFEALKVFDTTAAMIIGSGISVSDNTTTVYSQTRVSVDPLPILSVQGDLISFTMERKRLIDLFKGQVPHDEHGRVVMTWGRDELEVRSYGSEDGMTIPVKTIGQGSRGVNANLMLDMLGGIDDAKVVSVRIAQGSPAIILSAPEYDAWTLLVAPLIQ